MLQQGIADFVGEAEIVQDLQGLSDRIVALQTQAGTMSGSGNAPSTKPEEDAPGITNEVARNFERMLAMLERQTTQVERVLRRCNENRDQLERVERRLIETTPLLERQLPELRDAVDHQRQRVTALAIAVERLSRWLVTQQGSGS